jgi:hypothetical protein
MGLKDKIITAKTQDEIKQLLAEGKTYHDASPKTKRRYVLLAAKRSRLLEQVSSPAKPDAKPKKLPMKAEGSFPTRKNTEVLMPSVS